MHYDSELVEKIARKCCRRYHLADEDCSDFIQDVHLKLLEDDCARLKRFKGKSSIETFLHATLKHLSLDFVIRKKGKWHASAAAKRLGPVAVQLELLMYRDGNSREEATQIVLSKNAHALSDVDIRRIALELPARTFGRREVSDATDAITDSHRADEELLDHAREHDEATAREKLGKVLAKLDPEDRLIIQMRYWSGFTVVRIAKTLKIEQRQLYDRIARILKLLKALLRDDGLKLDDVKSILGD